MGSFVRVTLEAVGECFRVRFSERAVAETQVADISNKEKIGEARGDLRNQWAGLLQYLDDGELPIDNNLSNQFQAPARSLRTDEPRAEYRTAGRLQ